MNTYKIKVIERHTDVIIVNAKNESDAIKEAIKYTQPKLESISSVILSSVGGDI